MRNFGIVLVSHGKYAVETLNSIEMIAGQQEGLKALELDVNKSLEQLHEELTETVANLKEDYEYVLALCDLYGGTPFNTLLRKLIEGEDLLAFTGFNLPLVLSVALAGESTEAELIELIHTTHNESLVNVVELVKEG